uniref:CCHC-type domain-containing protein n=1 Tax=Poecilia formosa TaxID=48698 RepID=A0A096M937_POEFO
VFYTLPNTGDTFTAAIAALNEHFVPKVKVIAERHKFRQRAQRPDETVNQLASLWELAATCDFGNMEDQMLRDQLIERVANTRIRDRLLLEPDLTLAKATTLALQTESGLRDANVLSDATAASASASVRAVQKQPKQSRRWDIKKKPPDPAPATTQAAANRCSCFCCGSFNHLANKPSCSAAKMTCNKCGKVGHFSRVCRSTQKEVHEVVINEPTVLYMNNAVQDKILCTVQVTFNGQCKNVELIVDTGSSVSIIPDNIYHTYFYECVLTEPTFALVTYAKEKISVKGCLKAISHDSHSTAGTLVVESGAALLGLDLFQALQMKLEGCTPPTPMVQPAVPETVSDYSPDMSVQEVGYAKNFIHKVHILPNAVPVQQKLRRLPFSIREAVSEELKDLQDKGIIERIDASPWVSPIVVTQRRDGGKPCTNLRGATVFSTIDLASAYHQMPLHPESRDITAFITNDGLFRFCRVPFGLASVPSAFQKMSIILAGLPGVQAYLDDIICYSSTQNLTDAGLKLNMHKYQDKVTAVIHAPAPHDTSSLRSFLGLASWYSKFIPDFATVIEPLRAVLRDSTDLSFEWTTESDQTNGVVKRFNRVLKECIQTCERSHSSWKCTLKFFLFTFNSTPHLSTGYSPYFLAHGREPRLPANVHISSPKTVLLHHEEQKQKREYYYNKDTQFRPYACGDLVWI